MNPFRAALIYAYAAAAALFACGWQMVEDVRDVHRLASEARKWWE